MNQRGNPVVEKRRLARQHPIHHDAERIEIRSAIDLARHDLFGRHVFDRPHEHSCMRKLGLLIRRVRLGNPEVENLHEVVITSAPDEHYVGRLEITVNDASCVSDMKRGTDLSCDVNGQFWLEDLMAPQLSGERLPLEQLHHEEHVAFGAPEIVNFDDVFVLNASRVFCLTQEATGNLLIEGNTQGRSDKLHGDRPMHRQVRGSIDDTHPSDAQRHLDPVSPAKKARNRAVVIGHPRWASLPRPSC